VEVNTPQKHFNPTMVRLLLSNAVWVVTATSTFNPTMVRLLH